MITHLAIPSLLKLVHKTLSKNSYINKIIIILRLTRSLDVPFFLQI